MTHKEMQKIIEKGDRKQKELEQIVFDRQKPSELTKEYLDTCGDDLILITLKGHLVIENLLELNLCRLLGIDHLPKEKEDNYPELEFIHKLKLLQAVMIENKPGPNIDLFKAIAKLNSIRNKLAHNLKNPAEIELDVKSFIDSYQSKAGMKLRSSEPLPLRLKSCIYRLCQFLDSVNFHLYKLRCDNI